VYIAGNLGTLHHLKSDLRLIEQRQVRRLEAISKANTNAGTSSPTTNGTVGAISDSPLK
jgi:hypothetical protein